MANFWAVIIVIILILVVELIAEHIPLLDQIEHIPRADLVATATADAGVRIDGTDEFRLPRLAAASQPCDGYRHHDLPCLFWNEFALD